VNEDDAEQMRSDLGILSPSVGRRVRAVDATAISEQGSTGTDWRIHYAINLKNQRPPSEAGAFACIHRFAVVVLGFQLGVFVCYTPDLLTACRANYWP